MKNIIHNLNYKYIKKKAQNLTLPFIRLFYLLMYTYTVRYLKYNLPLFFI